MIGKERIMGDKEIRAQIDTDNVKNILWVEGGGIAILLPVLSVLIGKKEYVLLLKAICAGVFFLAIGVISILLHSHFRRRCSLAYSTGAPRKKILGIGLAEPWICHVSHVCMWSSYICLIVALGFIAYFALEFFKQL